MISTIAAAKSAALLLTDETARNKVGWCVALLCSPLILFAVLICSIGSGAAAHNTHAVQASFYGASYSDEIPAEYKNHVDDMRAAFLLLDSSVSHVNSMAEGENSLDPIRVKAVFYALCFGEDTPSRRAAKRFTECFCTMESRTRRVPVETPSGTITVTETYTVAVPLPLSEAYANLSSELGRVISEEEIQNADHIYCMIAGGLVNGTDGSYMGSGTYDGAYSRGDGNSIDLDVSQFVDPSSKNAADLVTYVTHAWDSGWGYVWGTYGSVLTDSLLSSKLQQYPTGVGQYQSFIRQHWVGRRTTDCVGLIKGYSWLDPESMSIRYSTNGMPDYGANQMYYTASVSGAIDSMPDTPGLAVWRSGHIGVYIGNGYVIEAMGTKYGVVKTALADRGWTHWLEIPYINYD